MTALTQSLRDGIGFYIVCALCAAAVLMDVMVWAR